MKNKTLIEKQTLLPFWLIGSAIIASVIHNFMYALNVLYGPAEIFGLSEAIFFIIALLLILGFFISIIYNVLNYLNKGEPKDIWKLGWLGLLGLLGIVAAPGMFGFFGFFAFFGLKK